MFFFFNLSYDSKISTIIMRRVYQVDGSFYCLFMQIEAYFVARIHMFKLLPIFTFVLSNTLI